VLVRADARRNYDQLVDQAKLAFAEFGADASLDEIARRAGVASGTLYRHFPTRLDLVRVVLAEQIAELIRLGRDLLTAGDAFAALTDWLRATLRHGLTYRGLAAEVLNDALSAAWHADLFETGAALLARAGRPGIADEVLRLVGAIAWANSQDTTERADRMLSIVLNGLLSKPGAGATSDC
jgi:AcrR family transcriptional regulator